MLAKDMMGVGMPAEFAIREGFPGTSAVTAAGSSTTDATVLVKEQRVVIMTATGADGIRLPSTAELMVPYIVVNTSGSTGKVYPPTSGTLNGAAADAAISVATLKAITCMRYSSTGWVANLSA